MLLVQQSDPVWGLAVRKWQIAFGGMPDRHFFSQRAYPIMVCGPVRKKHFIYFCWWKIFYSLLRKFVRCLTVYTLKWHEPVIVNNLHYVYGLHLLLWIRLWSTSWILIMTRMPKQTLYYIFVYSYVRERFLTVYNYIESDTCYYITLEKKRSHVIKRS